MTRRRFGVAAIALALSALAAGCGGGSPDLRVSAAASLQSAFTAYGNSFHAAHATFSFAGSDELAAQIRQGAKPDVFASANTALPDALYRQGRVERPVRFAANRLVLAVPAGGRLQSLAGAERPGTKIAVGSPTVPIGAYTATVLARLGPAAAAAIRANVRSREPDVAGIVAKLTQGAVDAGFVYVTDVRAAGGRLLAIRLPARAQPRVVYAAAVVRGSDHASEARAFIAGLTSGAGRRALLAAGFEPPR